MIPGPQMIPKLDRKWSRNACRLRIGPQMIPTKKYEMKWCEYGIGVNGDYYCYFFIIKIIN